MKTKIYIKKNFFKAKKKKSVENKKRKKNPSEPLLPPCTILEGRLRRDNSSGTNNSHHWSSQDVARVAAWDGLPHMVARMLHALNTFFSLVLLDLIIDSLISLQFRSQFSNNSYFFLFFVNDSPKNFNLILDLTQPSKVQLGRNDDTGKERKKWTIMP